MNKIMGEVKKIKPLMKMLVVLAAVVFIVTALSGCVEDTDDNGKEVTKIKVNGSSTVYPIAQLCAEAFNAENDDIEVQVVSPPAGSGGGITQLGEGTIDIADASRPVKDSEREEYSNIDFYESVVAYDAVAIIVSKEIYDSGVTNLTTQEVYNIYEGVITNWQDLGGPDKQIAVHQREEGSGTRATFLEYIYDDDEAVPSATIAGAWDKNSLLKTAVENADNAIGYCGLGYVDTATPAIALNNVTPSAETIYSGEYLISRELYMYTDGTPTGAIKEFIDFVKSDEGQDIAEIAGYVKLD